MFSTMKFALANKPTWRRLWILFVNNLNQSHQDLGRKLHIMQIYFVYSYSAAALRQLNSDLKKIISHQQQQIGKYLKLNDIVEWGVLMQDKENEAFLPYKALSQRIPNKYRKEFFSSYVFGTSTWHTYMAV